MAERVGRLAAALLEAGASVATAESCTGGLLGAALTAVPGASGWYRGGWVVYADELKVELAGIDRGALRRHGSVSRAVAEGLAIAVRERCGATYGIGITGIAGPGGGSPEKPVGLVWLARAGPGRLEARELRLPGGREAVRRATVRAAIDLLLAAAEGRDG